MAPTLTRLAVFCGSSPGHDEAMMRTAYDVGRGLAERGIGLVYGGGGYGLMGALADGALNAGGEVIGVIPRSMVEREWGREDLTELHVVETMHERKALMAELSDAFLALPGGIGMLEEIIEMWSWRQIGFNDDPVGFLDIGDFWRPLLVALRSMVAAGFVRQEVLDDAVVADTLDGALVGFAEGRGVEFQDKLKG
ncbi:TIGR00730 family Rossman fold protein [Nocardioides nematodiphilus]|uniref:LOG family protein n=1 Tax=Nocardioides nematodiphilus TaxID=2849669 RepID=UPI001CD9AA7F|nr:TIGR00730 family Rossman fold protein [Nocardioides nematodiphilus]MCA1981729.1 TIGR00730 family Rossman fold protein [Nocardioides nematodiphilus]